MTSPLRLEFRAEFLFWEQNRKGKDILEIVPLFCTLSSLEVDTLEENELWVRVTEKRTGLTKKE